MTAADWDRQQPCPVCEIPALVINLPHPDAPHVSCGSCGEAFYLIPARMLTATQTGDTDA